MTFQEVVKEEVKKTVGLDITSQQADCIAWEHTGFPEFWNIPEDGNTPEECLRKQVREFASTQLKK